MSISHHPDDATLMSFAAGTLSEPFAIVIASHLEMCGHCRETNRSLAMLGGAVLEGAAPEELSAGAVASLLARLDEPAPVNGHRIVKGPLPDGSARGHAFPEALTRLLGGGLDAIKWRHVVPGVEDRLIKFPNRRGVHTLRFLRAIPGKELPEHAHSGSELTLVLHGALRDGGHLLGPGDVSDMDDEGTHSPVVEGAETCVCVFANEGASRFKQLKFRVLQKLIGI